MKIWKLFEFRENSNKTGEGKTLSAMLFIRVENIVGEDEVINHYVFRFDGFYSIRARFYVEKKTADPFA